MKKSVFAIVAILVLILPMVLADASISIKTLPDHRVSVIVRNAGSLSTVDSVHKDTGFATAVNPDYVIVDYTPSISNSEIDILVTLKKNGVEILKENFNEISTSNFIKINLIPGESGLVDSFEEPEEVVEEEEVATEEETEVVEDEANEEESVSAGITGNAVEEVKGVLGSNTTYYVLGAIVALFALVFVIQVGRNKMGSSGNYKVVKFGASEDKRLLDAERKLGEAKKELDEINVRKKKLAEAKQKFQKDREELRELEE